MPFKSYALRSLNDGSLEFTDPQPLLFSGRYGLIARFVQAERERASVPWKISSAELHALIYPDGLTTERALVFEEITENTLELQWLQSVHGVSDTRTEMLFSFLPLQVEHGSSPLRVRHPSIDRSYSEELILDGGVNAPEGPWRWCKSHLTLGGVVLQHRKKSSTQEVLFKADTDVGCQKPHNESPVPIRLPASKEHQCDPDQYPAPRDC